ncbi:uncharacterized protein [Rutidosis leptorrhynchoides]|uniref:uncharacterized protein n=1 Tax=Rutidosis leptorrhynchoides TaxID=125765 RepID=UPI003A9922E1
MASISSSIISSTTYIHHHSSSKSFKTQQQLQLPISSKSKLSSQITLKCLIPRQPTRLFCVAEETAVTVDPTSEAARKLYVGNIPRTTNNDELQKVFEEHGSIEKVEVMYDKWSGRSRRFGFVTMKTVDDANAAIEKLNGTEIGGRKIKVNVTEKPLNGVTSTLLQSDETPFVDSPYKLYVGNLAKTVTSDSLKSFFADKGNVLGAKVSRVPGTSKSTGFGFVSFSSEEEVEAAISSFNDAVLEGQKIRDMLLGYTILSVVSEPGDNSDVMDGGVPFVIHIVECFRPPASHRRSGVSFFVDYCLVFLFPLDLSSTSPFSVGFEVFRLSSPAWPSQVANDGLYVILRFWFRSASSLKGVGVPFRRLRRKLLRCGFVLFSLLFSFCYVLKNDDYV